jgi:hypothetical protein
VLSRHGHIHRWRATLRERRITVLARICRRRSVAGPTPDIRTLAIASDPSAYGAPADARRVPARARSDRDLGTDGTDPVDYPDVAASVATAPSRAKTDAGIVIDSAGIGSKPSPPTRSAACAP